MDQYRDLVRQAWDTCHRTILHRSVLVGWMADVYAACQLLLPTFLLAVLILDTFMAMSRSPRLQPSSATDGRAEPYQTIGAACLVLAMQFFQERMSVRSTCRYLSRLTNGTSTARDIRHMHTRVLSAVGFDVFGVPWANVMDSIAAFPQPYRDCDRVLYRKALAARVVAFTFAIPCMPSASAHSMDSTDVAHALSASTWLALHKPVPHPYCEVTRRICATLVSKGRRSARRYTHVDA